MLLLSILLILGYLGVCAVWFLVCLNSFLAPADEAKSSLGEDAKLLVLTPVAPFALIWIAASKASK